MNAREALNLQRHLIHKYLAYAKRRGQKVGSVIIKIPKIPCITEGCKAFVPLLGAISYVAQTAPGNDGIATTMGVAYPCPKCGRLYNADQSPLVWKDYNKVFLDRNGRAVVKANNGVSVHSFWTSAFRHRNPRGRGRLYRNKRR